MWNHFDVEQDPGPDPYQNEKSDPDPHQSEKRDPDRIRSNMMRIRNTSSILLYLYLQVFLSFFL
jgi:hypothetical protein